MKRAATGLLVAAVLVAVTAAGPAGTGIAAPSKATITTPLNATGSSAPVNIAVNTEPPTAAPKVTLNPPESPSSNTTPSFTGTASATTPVIIQIHPGTTAQGTVVSVAAALGTGAGWMSGNVSPALASGQYVAVATQASPQGNATGQSEPVTFTVTPGPSVSAHAAPPVASFTWFPLVPQTGEPVTLVSTSTDAGSPITGLAWALTSNGPFQGGGVVLTSSFSTPGSHVVRMRVTNGQGLSSLATETINVVAARALLMQPFAVVRIVSRQVAAGVRVRLLKVQQLPAGARITVRCKGRGCPITSARRVTVTARRGVDAIEFGRFERLLHFGVVLEILIYKPGEIGKYTRFTIRRGTLPERIDTCLDPAGVKLMACPSS